MHGIADNPDFIKIKRRNHAVAPLPCERFCLEADRQATNEAALDETVNSARAGLLHMKLALGYEAVGGFSCLVPRADKVIWIVSVEHRQFSDSEIERALGDDVVGLIGRAEGPRVADNLARVCNAQGGLDF